MMDQNKPSNATAAHKPRRLAVIPARGGSTRIPRKNIVDFNGKPLLAWSIETALHSALFTKVIVSTDDAEIAAIARQYGAQVPFMRAANLADHYTGTFAVTKDAVQQLSAAGEEYDCICCLYATAPLLTVKHLQAACARFEQQQADYLYACCVYPFPIQRAQYFDDSGAPHPFMPDCMAMRSQDLTKAYQDAGQFYFYSRRPFYPDGQPWICRAYEMPRHRVIDIDEPEDLKFAAALARAVQELHLD